jgi:pyruvate,water dikinase
VNVTPDEVVRYSPRKLDVINLESGRFETVALKDLLAECGPEIPGVQQIVSLSDESGIHRPLLIDWASDTDRIVVTFDGLIESTPFLTQMRALLRLLKEKTGGPVDIEFASDGKDFYLLQCRPQSFSEDVASAPIPQELPADKVVFEARRYVSNGRMPDITHIVYVDPERYAALEDADSLRRVGRAVGRLNKVLPKRQFILMGPGRWGSRGDVKLGVPVTYSDINNTAALIEIARKRGNYVPDVSFGTHFFQDLVEASIRYLPLFPDDPDIMFHEKFLTQSTDILADVAPEFADLAGTVRVIDVPRATGGLVLRVLLNADEDRAVGFLASPGAGGDAVPERKRGPEPVPTEDHARWRLRMAERVAAAADAARFGIKGFYLFGSTKNGTAGPGSDINLLVHFSGTAQMRRDLTAWLEGWSLCLAEMNYLRTGVRTDGLLDVHFVTDADLESPSGYAAKIGAVTDAARPLAVGTASG